MTNHSPERDGVPQPVTAEAQSAQGGAFKPTLRRLFVGDDGLRAGWSCLLYVLLIAIIGLALQMLLLRIHLVPPPSRAAQGVQSGAKDLYPRPVFIGEAVGFLSLLLASLVMTRVERRPFARYGLPARRLLPDFAMGLFWGLFFLSLLVGAIFLTHGIAWDGLALRGAPALAYGARWALVFLFVGLLEEFLFRGYFQYTVARGVAGIARAMAPRSRRTYALGFWVAATLFSIVLFTLTHTGNPGENVSGIFAVALAGAVFAFSLWRTGSLWWAIGFHTTWDWAQSYLYGTPDSGGRSFGHLIGSHPIGNPLLSGGSAGPEGSLLVIPTMLLAALAIHLTLPYRTRPMTADQTPPPEYVALLPDQLV